MKSPSLYSNKVSGRLLILLMIIHLIGTIVAYAVYIKISSLGDGYLVEDYYPSDYQATGFTRTWFVHAIYYYIGIHLPNFWTPLLFGQIVAIATWHTFKDVYLYINRQLFWACNLFPHFLVWSGSSSKEQILIIFGVFVISFVAKRTFASHRLTILNLFFVCLSLAIICLIRPNYFVIYFTIFITSLLAPLLNKTKIYRLSFGIWSFIFITLGIFSATIFIIFFSKDIIAFMREVEYSFLYLPGGSNRYDIQWENISDFFYNIPWGIPQGLIGPTLFESILKPIQFPVFVEGIFYLIILCYMFAKLLKIAHVSNNLRVHILPYFFVVLAVIIVSYPYLIFNAGAALRYKQSMHPVIIFYPLLIFAYARAYNLIKRKQ